MIDRWLGFIQISFYVSIYFIISFFVSETINQVAKILRVKNPNVGLAGMLFLPLTFPLIIMALLINAAANYLRKRKCDLKVSGLNEQKRS